MAQCINNKLCLGACNPIQSRLKQWNRVLLTQKGKSKFTAPSLYEIAKLRVRDLYRQNWGEIKCLPQTIQNELLTDWFQCGEIFPLSSDEEDTLKEIIARNDPFHPDRPHALPTECFIALMSHPEEVPSIAYEENHVHFHYIVRRNIVKKTNSRMCTRCFYAESNFVKPYSENLWKKWGVLYFEHTDHSIILGENLLDEVIWDPDNWCDFCITEPLFFIVDKEECRAQYGLHTRKRSSRFWDDYSTDDDSDTDYCCVKQVKGNSIDDSMFNFLKF